jgi:hypothetical protein
VERAPKRDLLVLVLTIMAYVVVLGIVPAVLFWVLDRYLH